MNTDIFSTEGNEANEACELLNHRLRAGGANTDPSGRDGFWTERAETETGQFSTWPAFGFSRPEPLYSHAIHSNNSRMNLQQCPIGYHSTQRAIQVCIITCS